MVEIIRLERADKAKDACPMRHDGLVGQAQGYPEALEPADSQEIGPQSRPGTLPKAPLKPSHGGGLGTRAAPVQDTSQNL
jgi:hypothetical protein